MSDGFEIINEDPWGSDTDAPAATIDEPTSRRRLFKIGAVGVAAAGAALVGDALTSSPVGAATGGNMLIGESNATTGTHDLTVLHGGGGLSVGVGSSGDSTVGILGTASIGVKGVSNTGTTSPVGAGVQGVGGSLNPGLLATNSTGPSFQMSPMGSSTLPAKSATGQFIVLSDGALYYSYADDSWVPLTNGVVPLNPSRVVDTVTGVGGVTGPLAAGNGVHTTTEIAGTVGIPTQAIGVVGNFAISGENGALLNGYGVASIFPAGSFGAPPPTANINAGNGCFAISNSVTVGFGSGVNAGKLAFTWSGGGPVPNCQVFFDVAGYIL